MKIKIWSDFACPYCYIGKTRLDNVLKDLDMKDIEIEYKTFQLDPNAVRKEPEDYAQYLGKKYGSQEQGRIMVDGMKSSAQELGIDFNFDILIRNNTTLAHKILKISKNYNEKEDLSLKLSDRIFFAYFEEGKDIGDLETLLTLVEEIGLDREEIKNNLEKNTSKYQNEINKDYNQAVEMGLRGVPLFVIDDKVSISGARSEEDFKLAIREAIEN